MLDPVFDKRISEVSIFEFQVKAFLRLILA